MPLGKAQIEWCRNNGRVTDCGYSEAGVQIFEYYNHKSKAHFYFYETPLFKPLTTIEDNT